MMYLRAQIRPKSVSNSFENRTSKGTEEDNRKVVFFFLFHIRKLGLIVHIHNLLSINSLSLPTDNKKNRIYLSDRSQ